jgi:hypothetical protein
MSFGEIFEEDGQDLTVAHPLKHLSPSSLKTWRRCQTEFFLKKLSKHKEDIKRRPQGIAASVGNAFDSFIKALLIEETTMDEQDPYELIAKTVTNKNHLKEAIDVGQRLAAIYVQTAYQDLLEEIPHGYDTKISGEFEGIPILGYIDFRYGINAIGDWKTSGYGGAPKSPTKGWCKKWKGGIETGKCHKLHNEPMEKLDENWAMQTAFYAFGLGHEPGEYLPVGIDQLSMRNVATPDEVTLQNVVVTKIRSYVSAEYQYELAAEIHNAWRDIQNLDIERACPSARTCYPFRMVCEASSYCKEFPRFQSIILAKSKRKKQQKEPENKPRYTLDSVKDLLGDMEV